MVRVSMQEPESRFSELVELAESGERVVITRAGVPVAELLPLAEAGSDRRGGQRAGSVWIADDFDAPSPDVERLFAA